MVWIASTDFRQMKQAVGELEWYWQLYQKREGQWPSYRRRRMIEGFIRKESNYAELVAVTRYYRQLKRVWVPEKHYRQLRELATAKHQLQGLLTSTVATNNASRQSKRRKRKSS